MSSALALLIALLLDARLGEPAWLWSRLPHPAVLMGRLVRLCDERLNRGTGRRAKGVATALILVAAGLALGAVLSLFGPVVEVIAAAILIAQKSLTQHVSLVAEGLRQSMAEGRYAVSMIVSRNTEAMDTSQVARSAIESGSENLSDGVIAPAFWFLIAGLPGLIVYKLVNTADSMIGYRNARYGEFGWAAARLDDLLNLIPARLTAVLIALPARQLKNWRAIAADARLHRSPNAGWPEAAMARALDVALAGPRAYDGRMQQFAWVNHGASQTIGAADIDACVAMLWRAWRCFAVAIALLAVAMMLCF